MDMHFTGALPPDSPKRTSVHRVTTASAQQFVIYSRSIFGQWVHWYGNRSHQCTKEKSACNGCQRGWPSKWLGYLDVHNLMMDERQFLEITLTASKLLIRQAPEGKPLRGLQIRVSKTKGGPKGRYMIDVLPRVLDEPDMPVEKDPLPTLQFLWRAKNQHASDE